MSAKDLVEFVAKKLVAHPDSVSVRLIEGDSGETVQLTVHEADMGRIIGRNGRTVKAIRTLLYAAGTKTEKNLGLEITNQTEAQQ